MDSVSIVNLQKNLVVDTIYHSSFNQPFTATIDKKRNLVYITNSNSTTVSIIDAATRQVVGIIDGFDGPSGLVIGHDGNFAYVNNYGAPGGVGSGNGTTISVVDLNTLSISETITVDLAPIAMAIGKCGDLLYSISYVDGLPGTGTMQVIDLETNLVSATVTGFSGPFGIDVSKKNAYITNFGSNNFAPYGTSVSVVNLVSLTISHTVENVGIQPSGVVVYKSRVYVTNYNSLYDGATLITGQGTVSVIDADSNKLLPITYEVDQAPANITAANNRLYVSNWTSNTVSVIPI
jgi:YVTN family beta-propeller protein